MSLPGSSAGDAGTGGASVTDAGADDAAVGFLVGPEGGTFSGSGVTVTIPPGALTDAFEFSVSVDADGTIDIAPEVLLSAPATVHISLSPSAAPPDGEPALWQNPAGEFVEVSQLTSEAGGVAFATGHFSRFIVRSTNAVSSWEDPWLLMYAFPSGGQLATLGAVTTGSLAKVRSEASSIVDQGPGDIFTSGQCLVDIRNFINTSHQWKGDPVSTDHGDCNPLSATACENALAAKGACVSVGTKYKCRYPRNQNEVFLMSLDLAVVLEVAADLVDRDLPGYQIWINGALDSSGVFHSQSALTSTGLDEQLLDSHYLGAAVDLSLCHKGNCIGKVSQIELDKNLPQLAALLVGAGFSWVFYEDMRHVHASIVSNSCGYADKYNGCNTPKPTKCDRPVLAPGSLNNAIPATGGSTLCPDCYPVLMTGDGVPDAPCVVNAFLPSSYCCKSSSCCKASNCIQSNFEGNTCNYPAPFDTYSLPWFCDDGTPPGMCIMAGSEGSARWGCFPLPSDPDASYTIHSFYYCCQPTSSCSC